MSNRNTQANKQAARERLRAERERQAKKDKMRRQLTVGGAIVAVLAIAGGIGVMVAKSGGGDGGSGDTATVSDMAGNDKAWAKAAKAKLVEPAHTSGDKGTTVVIGKADAKHTLDLFEDPRCPGCAGFEQNVGETVQKDIADGKYKARFHLATFLDANLKGTGSKNALSALGSALNVSPEAFLKYKEALYSKEFHPDEMGPDKFADDAYLIKVADTVPALKGNKDFEKAVTSGTYDRWALEMSVEFNSHNVNNTPTIKLDDKVIGLDSGPNKVAPTTPQDFNRLVDAGLK
ncbi:thioredoxin domain-containing protein [Streptomyces catenulae]|uniref:Thioredoxin domain-containing protein n=1 Tax=Streptomyces catenulae TaxID=66875 RepID=A0ABV2Z3B8_9ACTN|nr:thioredoxin domain-containing protein [Streptomyces catenulae]